MEVAIIVARITVIPPMLLATVSLVQTVRNHRTNTAALREVSATTDTLVRKVEEVHELTNANFAGQREDLAVQRDEITELHRQIEDLKTRLEQYKQFS